MNNILCVCIGNICRSPMAEGLLQSKLPNKNVSSAGIHALVGESADPIAIELLTSQSVDIKNHKARQISSLLCKQSDLILVMESFHKDFLLERYPFCRGKIYHLCESRKMEIPDPYRQGKSAFEYSLTLIAEGVDDWAKKLLLI